MPSIEVLPNSTSVATPGYALVPDTRFNPTQAAQPVFGRKRAARNLGFSASDTSARQQNAIAKHIAELDKDSHRDVQILVPAKLKESNARVSKSKTTQNVRRILMSQKTFANHLADEEATLTQQTSLPTPRFIPKPPTNTPHPAPSSAPPASTPKDPLASDPLLRSHIPPSPSAETMHALTTAPALSYNASRATLPQVPKPPRHFCEICGYWGSIKCLKCGARVCGLECKGAHDDGRCLKFYA